MAPQALANCLWIKSPPGLVFFLHSAQFQCLISDSLLHRCCIALQFGILEGKSLPCIVTKSTGPIVHNVSNSAGVTFTCYLVGDESRCNDGECHAC